MKATPGAVLVALAAAGCSATNIDAVTRMTAGDARPVPTISVDASADGHTAAMGRGLHTQGTRIVDDSGKDFAIRAVTWYGLDQDFFPHGLSFLRIDDILKRMQDLGFNTIRMTWSSEMLDADSMPMSIDYTVNPDLVGVTTPRALLGKVIDHAEAIGMKIILSRRRASKGSPTNLWWDTNYGQDRFFGDWVSLASQYRGRPTVIGCDLESDLRGEATWGDGNQNTDWKAAAERAGNEILAANTDVLIFVEGIETVGTASYWKGGNLQGVKTAQIKLAVPDHLVYATQDFPRSFPDLPKQGVPSWFSDPTYPANLAGVWDANWGFVFEQRIAPVFVTGFSTPYKDASDIDWLSALTTYIHDNGLGYAYYAVDDDTPGGIYTSFQLNTVNQRLIDGLAPLR